MVNNTKPASSYESALKGASASKSILFNFGKTYPAYLLLVVTVALSFLVQNLMTDKVKDDRKAAFDKAATSVITRLDRKYEVKSQILSSMKGLFDRSFVVKDVFELNGSIPTSTYPSLISIDFVYFTNKSKLDDFLFNAKSEGNYDIAIYPPGNDRENYYIIDYIVPFDKNKHRTGYDIATDDISKKAIDKAILENTIVSVPFTNIRKDTLGFYLISPVYKKGMNQDTKDDRLNNKEGALILEIEATKYFDEAIGQGIASDSTIIFEISDSQAQNNKSIYKSKNYDLLKIADFVPYIKETKKVKIADREVDLIISTVPNFGGAFQNYLPLASFIGALITSFVLFGFVMSVITSRARALDLAERMTRSQRRIVDSSKDVIAVLDFEGHWKSMNPASNEIFALSPDQLIGSKIDDLFNNPDDSKQFYSLAESYKDEFTERVDLQMKEASGKLKWINWSFTISKTDRLVYAIGRDVTLEKIAEEQAKLRTKQIQLAEQFSREAAESKTYFLTQLGHQLRNSLTGIVGYLQLVSGKIYETEEELDSFVGMASESSEELFTYVSDLVDKAEQSDEMSRINIGTIDFNEVIKQTNKRIIKEIGRDTKINVEILNDSEHAVKMVADAHILSDAMIKVYDALSSGLSVCDLQLLAQENSYEGATEIQITSTANPLVEEMLLIYKENRNHIVDALKFDKQDIMFDLATVESNIRRMNGTMTVDSLGSDGNVIMLTLPLTKKAE